MDSLDRLTRCDALKRLVARDASLFSDDSVVQAEIATALGWVGLAHHEGRVSGHVRSLAASLAADGYSDAILCGMGGSSLASIVLERCIGTAPGWMRLHVLDTTCPETVLDVVDSVTPARTVVIVSSKSGSTIEPLSLYSILRGRFDASLGSATAGRHFVALTDAGSQLEALAGERGFRQVISTPPSIGGRYSALTAFHLLPAALMGADTDELLRRAAAMEDACGGSACESPGAALAAFMIDATQSGRDKLTLLTSPGLASFALWVEQLIAESLGKKGRGIVPVPASGPETLRDDPADRMVALIRFDDDDTLPALMDGVDVPAFDLVLSDAYDVGAEFVRWQYATALAGSLLDVDPFDQPNVAEAKNATAALLDGSLPAPSPVTDFGGARVSGSGIELPAGGELADALLSALTSVAPMDYLALLAYVPEREATVHLLTDALEAAAAAVGVAGMLELGPRYLHSTGQLHKGGPDSGVFIIVIGRDGADIPVAGRPFTLRRLFEAQAEGDFVTLSKHRRRALLVELEDTEASSIEAFATALALAASRV